jgi:O-antigen ligase
VTIADSFINIGATETDSRLAVARFGVHPLFVTSWVLLRYRDNRRGVFHLDRAALPAILLASWFVLGASLAEDPIVSLGRAVPLCIMIWGAFCVSGPTLASPRGVAVLFRAAFIASLLVATTAVAAAFVGYQPSWGLYGDRFYGPLSATTLGPVCVSGLFAAFAVGKLSTSRLRVTLVVLASLWLLLILVVTRARGSYAFFIVGSAVIYALSSRRTLLLRFFGVGIVVSLALTIALNWWSLDLSQSRTATFLRLDQRDMLAQRSEVWTANASFWMEHPILGVGLGSEAAMSEVAKRSHSAYLSTLNEGGLPSLLLLLLSLTAIGRRCLRTALKHPAAELRLLGVTTLALLVGSAALGIVETTLINAASTANTFLWITAATAVVASRQRVPHSNRVGIASSKSFTHPTRFAFANTAVR